MAKNEGFGHFPETRFWGRTPPKSEKMAQNEGFGHFPKTRFWGRTPQKVEKWPKIDFFQKMTLFSKPSGPLKIVKNRRFWGVRQKVGFGSKIGVFGGSSKSSKTVNFDDF